MNQQLYFGVGSKTASRFTKVACSLDAESATSRFTTPDAPLRRCEGEYLYTLVLFKEVFPTSCPVTGESNVSASSINATIFF